VLVDGYVYGGLGYQRAPGAGAIFKGFIGALFSWRTAPPSMSSVS
jgi:hypothetical protein